MIDDGHGVLIKMAKKKNYTQYYGIVLCLKLLRELPQNNIYV